MTAVLERATPFRRLAVLLWLALLALIATTLSGCASYQLREPATVTTPSTVHVLDYGRHASLAIEQPDGAAEEWFWGDWDWFARGRRGVLDGVEALFASQGSTLGRRRLPGPRPDLTRQAGVLEKLTLRVERDRADALQRQLEQRFARGGSEIIRHPDGRSFVRDPAPYSLTNNSVHEVVRWLRQLGVEVRGNSPSATFRLVAQERRARDADNR